MKIKDITEYGFYKILLPIDSIAEALKDEDENGNEILSIMLWSWMDTIDGIKFYQTDMVALNPDNDDIRMYDIEKLDTDFKIVTDGDPYYYLFGASSVMYEDKLSNTDKIEKIKKICKKASTKTTFVSNGRDYIEVKDSQKLAIRILKILQE